MIKRGFRMRKATDFSKTYKFGKSYNATEFYIKSLKTNYSNSKFAVVVPKKITSKAVTRNTIRRRIYEIIRNSTNNISSGYTIIITVKADISNLDHKSLQEKIIDGFKKSGLLVNEKNTQ